MKNRDKRNRHKKVTKLNNNKKINVFLYFEIGTISKIYKLIFHSLKNILLAFHLGCTLLFINSNVLHTFNFQLLKMRRIFGNSCPTSSYLRLYLFSSLGSFWSRVFVLELEGNHLKFNYPKERVFVISHFNLNLAAPHTFPDEFMIACNCIKICNLNTDH